MIFRLKRRYIGFIIAGIIFCFISILLYINYSNFMKTAISTTAEISDIRRVRSFIGRRSMKVVYVSYVVDGKKYKARLNHHSIGTYEGKEITVYYQKDDPYVIKVVYDIIHPLIYGGCSIIFILIGVSGILESMKKDKIRREVLVGGHKVDAEIVDVKFYRYPFSGNIRPCRAICKYRSPEYEIYYFTSEVLRFDPRVFVEGNTVPVYVDPNNYKKYYVNIADVVHYDFFDYK